MTPDGIEYKEVPEDWKSHLDQAEQATEAFKNDFYELPSVNQIGLGRGPQKFGDLNGFQISVEVSNKESIPDFPNTFSGIPVKISQADRRELEVACFHDKTFDPLYGGIPMGPNGAGEAGTLGAVIKHNDDKVAVTNNHVTDDDGDACTNPDTTEDVDQDTQDLGDIRFVDETLDFATCKINSNIDKTNYIIEDDGTTRHIGSYYAENGVSYLISTGETVKETGIATGTQTGKLLQKDIGSGSGCGEFYGEGVKSNIYSAAGDSGRMCYNVDSEGFAAVIYLHNSGSGNSSLTDCDNDTYTPYSYGASCYEISNQYSSIDWYW